MIATTLEQSRKLVEIGIDQSTADMYYWCRSDLRIGCYKATYPDYYFPAWSLSALLDIYPMVVGRDMDMYCCWQNKHNLASRHYDNPIDACVEMICKLKENKFI